MSFSKKKGGGGHRLPRSLPSYAPALVVTNRCDLGSKIQSWILPKKRTLILINMINQLHIAFSDWTMILHCINYSAIFQCLLCRRLHFETPLDRGVARIFQRGGGGHTVSNIIVMASSPRNIVGCFLKKGLQRGGGGSRAPHDTPSLRALA